MLGRAIGATVRLGMALRGRKLNRLASTGVRVQVTRRDFISRTTSPPRAGRRHTPGAAYQTVSRLESPDRWSCPEGCSTTRMPLVSGTWVRPPDRSTKAARTRCQWTRRSTRPSEKRVQPAIPHPSGLVLTALRLIRTRVGSRTDLLNRRGFPDRGRARGQLCTEGSESATPPPASGTVPGQVIRRRPGHEMISEALALGRHPLGMIPLM
jgi:hypothetical protein